MLAAVHTHSIPELAYLENARFRDWTATSEDPVNSRDLLKKLYQQLFPKKVRHDLGEYYTPDWLAEHVLNELGYDGDPDKRLLDPACGSGTFLVMAINRVKRWYANNRERCGYDQGDLCRKILANVIGFDLNPLAVMAARTNYLIAIRDLVSHTDKTEIPVYLCDSILTPSEYGGLWAGSLGVSRELKTAASTFIIPLEIAGDRESIAKYADLLESCIKNHYPAKEFLERCKDEGLSVDTKNLHKELYDDLVRLDKENKNGVWARIIKNSFAPLFIGKVDFVAGNPPWVNWENLPEEYRNQTAPIWDRYRLRGRSSGRAALGKSKHELAALFLFSSADSYLNDGGRLGFVITQSLFKNKGAAGFRSFQINKTHLKPIAISDFVPCTVFEGAVNRTATLVVSKQESAFNYPVPYRTFYPQHEPELPEMATLETILGELTEAIDMDAVPCEDGISNSAWLTCPKGTYPALKNVLGPAYFRAFEGVNSGGLVGAYWVQAVRSLGKSTTLIENLWNAGKIKVPHITHQVEEALLYPFLRGRDVRKWRGRQAFLYLMTHDPVTRKCISERQMRLTYPKAYEFLSNFKKQLLERKTAPVRQQMADGPFYPILGIGPHTVSPWKVVFKDLTELFQACVLGPDDSSMPGKPLLPDCTLRLIPAQSENEAHFIAALLNSAPSVAALYYSSAGVQTQRYHAADAEKVRIGIFTDEPLHRQLAELSKKCHRAAMKDDWAKVVEIEAAIDIKAADYWGISPKHVRRIEQSLALTLQRS